MIRVNPTFRQILIVYIECTEKSGQLSTLATLYTELVVPSLSKTFQAITSVADVPSSFCIDKFVRKPGIRF